MLAAVKVAGFDLVIVETSGIGQGDAAIVPLVDVPLYVMTPEFGAASQLEKIDMLDFAEFVAINKFDRKGAADALRDVAKQVQRNREAFGKRPDEMPVFGTMASRFNDDGVTALYQAMLPRLAALGLPLQDGALPKVATRHSSTRCRSCPPRACATWPTSPTPCVATRRPRGRRRALPARSSSCARARACCSTPTPTRPTHSVPSTRLPTSAKPAWTRARASFLPTGQVCAAAYAQDEYVHAVRGREIRTPLQHTTLSGNKVPKVSLPTWECDGEILKWLLLDNVPGSFPYAGGTFAFKREGEDPTRMFAGEGDAFKTNTRFKLLSAGMPAKRLSTAFDSVTLYGNDPALRPDIYGKVGNSGVSIATLDDMKVLYSGFDLTSPSTSVSMTINGPAPTILAMFMNTAIDQKLDAFRGRERARAEQRRSRRDRRLGQEERARHGAGRHPEGRPGAEHLHLLDRVLAQGDGRHRRVLRRQRGAQLLLGERSRAITSPKPARTRSASSPSRSRTASPSSRPTSRAACRSTTSRPTCRSSSRTAWTRSTP